MHDAVPALLIALGAYLIGSLSFAVIVAKLMGLPDPRSFGSGNPGATNVLRTGNKAAALLTLLGDLAKGWLAVWLAGLIGAQYGIQILAMHGAALAVFLGHLFPVFFGFKGGKGVATALGILLAIDPWLGLSTLTVWLVVFAVSRLSSLAALTASVSAPILGTYFTGSHITILTLCLLTVLLVWRHRANIRRLLAGEESAFRKG
jgi:glycerol-3-phosphate acyltransferase PlsY